MHKAKKLHGVLLGERGSKVGKQTETPLKTSETLMRMVTEGPNESLEELPHLVDRNCKDPVSMSLVLGLTVNALQPQPDEEN